MPTRASRVADTTPLRPVPQPSPAALFAELRSARAELGRLQSAFGNHGGPDADRIRIEIRLAEQKIAALRSQLKAVPEPTAAR